MVDRTQRVPFPQRVEHARPADIAWAQVWRSQQREDNTRQRLRTDSHSPEEYRTNGVVRNLDEWYAAFGITEDDPMYIPPEQRVRIW